MCVCGIAFSAHRSIIIIIAAVEVNNPPGNTQTTKFQLETHCRSL